MRTTSSIIHQKVVANRETLLGFGVKKMGLFGSFRRNEQTQRSDVDILVEFSKGKKNADNFLDLAFYLENLLKKKVDLLTPKSLSPMMKRRVLQEVDYFKL
jgi:predicted nucleotidyltransferase